jgi:RNA polymerase sigma factor (sigma-70 family)
MGQPARDRDQRPGPPEAFDEFYVREYPRVVGLLQGLLRSRIVAEELAQETFLVAYRDWDRVSSLDNPRAWVRKVALNQRGSFLRAYLRQQARERDSAVQYQDDTIKLADDHAEVWQAVRTLPPSQAQVIALHYYEDYSIVQIAAALPGEPLASPPAGPPRRTRRLALAVNLVLVLALGVVFGVVGARQGRHVGAPVPSPPASSVVVTSIVPRTVPGPVVQIPDACLAATELADEVISRLNRNDRDNRLALALRDYTIASQACRREAAPTTGTAGP